MERLIVSPNGFRQIAKPSKEKMEKMAVEATTLAEQAAVIITQLLIERKAMDQLVDELIEGKQDAALAIVALRQQRLEAPGEETEVVS
jgi:hypothetical protein